MPEALPVLRDAPVGGLEAHPTSAHVLQQADAASVSQRGAYATQNVESSTTGEIDGPMISGSDTILIGQSSVATFPPINFLNQGSPGDNTPTAKPAPLMNYGGG